MQNLCSNCGSLLPSDLGYCSNCGQTSEAWPPRPTDIDIAAYDLTANHYLTKYPVVDVLIGFFGVILATALCGVSVFLMIWVQIKRPYQRTLLYSMYAGAAGVVIVIIVVLLALILPALALD